MPQVSVNSIGEYIREQREQAKISLRQLSQAAGVSNPYLSQIERGLRKPSAEILQQIAKGLRISAEALYVQAGILEDRPADSGVRSALLADPSLSERQKQVLVEIYESFRKESGAAGGSPVGDGATVSLMPRAVAAVDPAPRPDDRPVRPGRGARGASSRAWATATDDLPGLDEAPGEPQSPAAGAAGTGWPADVPPHTGD
ncbi:MAG: helix-turn-helix transcriptional regulator [Streptosporangiaceae bacterium]|jgi:transcriptional regulator with XRE-family HTH domain